MTASISYRAARQIADHAFSRTPEEVCGLFAGRGRRISRVFPISSIAAEPTAAYRLEPSEQLRALKQIDAAGLEWLGVYHSHPQSDPIPSVADIQQASDEGLWHLIVSLRRSRPRLKLWHIQASAATPIDLRFDTQSSQEQPDEPLSDPQKIAVVLAAALGLILMLAVSLTLLPPAPVLP